MPTTDTSTTVTDVEKAQIPRHTRFDEEVQAQPEPHVAWWTRVGKSVRHGIRAATAATQWSENRASSSSSGGTSGTGSREGRPTAKRQSTQSTFAGIPGEKVDADDGNDPAPVNLVVVDSSMVRDDADAAAAESDGLSDHTETPVASRYTAPSDDRSNPACLLARLVKNVLVRKLWPLFKAYCDSSFPDKHQERVFQHELWFVDKRPALLCSIFLVVEYALILSLIKPKNDFWSYWVSSVA